MDEGEIKSGESKPQQWDYETHFREYLLMLSRKKIDGLEFFANFPRNIKLNNVWHETLSQMDKETKDGHERWALIGFRDDMRHLILPRIFGIGTKTDYQKRIRASVPSKVIQEEIQKAKDKRGVIGLVGDIHSHPGSFSRQISFEMLGFRRVIGAGGGFSAGDLYRMVIKGDFLPVTVVVDGGESFFAFKTRESTDIPVSSLLFPQNVFEKYWYEEYGVRLEGDFAKHIPRGFSHLELNKGIAAKHNLVLYNGRLGEDLTRVYPE